MVEQLRWCECGKLISREKTLKCQWDKECYCSKKCENKYYVRNN